jgi:hypothetical protein
LASAAPAPLRWKSALVSDTISQTESLSFASNPAVASRFVYSVAIRFNEQSASLFLVALDLMDGRLIFKCTHWAPCCRCARAHADPPGWDEFTGNRPSRPSPAIWWSRRASNVGMTAPQSGDSMAYPLDAAYEEKW